MANSTSNLLVRVANGQCLHSKGVCEEFNLRVQGNNLQTSFYLLQLAGCDMVLGIQWLQTLGSITWDFSKLVMTFVHKVKHVNLKGLKLKPSRVVESHKMSKYTTNKGKGILLQIMGGAHYKT